MDFALAAYNTYKWEQFCICGKVIAFKILTLNAGSSCGRISELPMGVAACTVKCWKTLGKKKIKLK